MTQQSPPTAKLLAVDDVESNLVILSAIFSHAGVELLKARSGTEALELLLIHDVALAIIDIQMPHMDGLELAELMRGAQRTRNVPIIFLTAGVQDNQRRFRGYELGAVDFLYKPLEPEVLRSKANVFLDLYRQRQEIARQRDELRTVSEEKSRLLEERRRAEEALQKLNLELEARISERTADLRRSLADREKLQDQLLQAQKMESIGTLASGIAHDFNNLLNIISSYAGNLRSSDKDPATIAEAAAVIEETVRRGATLVQQLMTLGRRIDAQFAPVAVNEIIKKLAGLLAETFPKTISIALKLESELPRIEGNENQLHQILLNLCVNARDAMPEGGSIVISTGTVSGKEVRGRAADCGAERYIAIAVQDTGTGMDEATQRRMFEPFFTTKPVGQGTGLGLAVVYGVIKEHGGAIEVNSRVGCGTTFRLFLPVPPDSAARDREIQPIEEHLGHCGAGQTILFVDDEERQLILMKRVLEKRGYRVITAGDGVDALEKFKDHQDEIALAVLDLGLPKLGGWETLQQMRKLKPQLTALITTGFVSPELEAEIMRAGIGSIVTKPYDLDEVTRKISSAIAGPSPAQES